MMDVGSVLLSDDARQKDGVPAHTVRSYEQVDTKWSEKGFKKMFEENMKIRNAQLSLNVREGYKKEERKRGDLQG